MPTLVKAEGKDKWFGVEFSEYLEAVDEKLCDERGYPSTETEISIISEAQDSLMSPEECASKIVEEEGE